MSAAGDHDFARRAVFRLSLIEFWERYSYYTTFALMALFAAAPVATGGMGWKNAESLRFFGAYLFAIQITPLVGGFVADRWLGKRAALRIGAGALALGHSLLALSAALPWRQVTGEPLNQIVSRAGASMGHWTVNALPASSLGAYRAVTAVFFAGVVLIAVGNGLFKPILTVVVGRLPFGNQADRNRAFTTFFLYINIGGLMSIILGGWLAQQLGWSFAFGGSAIGMLIAIATMIALDARYIRPFVGNSITPTVEQGTGGVKSSSVWISLGALLILLALCASFSYQSYGFISLFTAQRVHRDVAGFVIPPNWFIALNPIVILGLTPLLLKTWRRGSWGSDWSTVQHFAAALLLMALGFGPLIGAALQAGTTGLAHPLWVAATVMLIAASELLYAPAGMAASIRIAPPSLQTVAIGAQGAAIGVGAWASGQIGALAFESGEVAVMSAVAITAAVASAALCLLRTRFAQWKL